MMSSVRRPTRWAFTMATLFVTVAACTPADRCATCGMKIDPASPWVSSLTVNRRELSFDTPHCAFAAWRRAPADVSRARFRDYYSQVLEAAEEVRFVAGSDVVGPMGPDLVPVAAREASRFARDHNGAPPRRAAEILAEEVP